MFSLNNIPIQKCHPFKIRRPKAGVLIQHCKRQWPAVEDTAGFKLSPHSGVSALWFWFRPTSNTCIYVFHVKRHFFLVISLFDHFLFTWIKALSSCCFLCSVFSKTFCQRWFRSSNLLRKLLASSTALDSIRSFPAFLTASTVDWWAKTSFCSTYNCNTVRMIGHVDTLLNEGNYND